MLAVRQGSEPRWRAFERMVALVILEWLSAPRHRDPIFERDGWRCSVPACTSRCHLHDHHLRFRALGGGHEAANRTAVCAAHHLHGIHVGNIHARGTAPDGITWDLGCRPGHEALTRTLGDQVLTRSDEGPGTCDPEPTSRADDPVHRDPDAGARGGDLVPGSPEPSSRADEPVSRDLDASTRDGGPVLRDPDPGPRSLAPTNRAPQPA